MSEALDKRISVKNRQVAILNKKIEKLEEKQNAALAKLWAKSKPKIDTLNIVIDTQRAAIASMEGADPKRFKASIRNAANKAAKATKQRDKVRTRHENMARKLMRKTNPAIDKLHKKRTAVVGEVLKLNEKRHLSSF